MNKLLQSTISNYESNLPDTIENIDHFITILIDAAESSIKEFLGKPASVEMIYHIEIRLQAVANKIVFKYNLFGLKDALYNQATIIAMSNMPSCVVNEYYNQKLKNKNE